MYLQCTYVHLNMKQLKILVDLELFIQFKVYCVNNNVNMSDVLREYMKKVVKQNKKV